MAITQDGRLLRIDISSLDTDFLLLNRFSASEGLSQLYSYDVELLHEETEEGSEATDVDVTEILGRGATITVQQEDDTTRTFVGMVNSFTKLNRSSRFSYYRARIVPDVWRLTKRVQSRIFQHKTVQAILEDIFEDFEVAFEIQGEFENRNYCVQYNESDFDFASRLMEEEGFFFYFDHESNGKMVIANTAQSHMENPGKSSIDYYVETGLGEGFTAYISDIQVGFSLLPGSVTFRDTNFQLPGNSLEVSQPSRFGLAANEKMEVYEYPGGYARKYDGIDRMGGAAKSNLNGVFPDRDRTATNAMGALDAQYEVLTGVSNCAAMTAGHIFSLDNHPTAALSRQYVITSVSHHAEQSPDYVSDSQQTEPYSNSFSCIPHGQGAPTFRPIKQTPKPIIHGSQLAVVVGPAGEEIFTDEYGRVKIQLPWDRLGQSDSDSSCWAKVKQTWAGNGWGTVFIPRIGMQVVVDFLAGDPDYPVISGCVYTPDNMPPYPLPDEKTKSTIKSDSTKGGGGFNELRFEDKKGKEQIFVHAQKDLDMRVKNDRRELVGNDRHTYVQRDKREHLKRDKHQLTERDEMKEVQRDFNLKVGENSNVEIGGDCSENIGGALNLKVGGEYNVDTTAKQSMVAREIVLDAQMGVTLKCGGGNFIKVHPAGVDIVGSMVKINSGGAAGSATSAQTIDPKAPEEALLADNADPGSPSPTYKNQLKDQTKFEKMMYGSAPSHNPNSAANEEKKSWIEIQLEDEEGNPVPGETYLVTLPDGSTVASGSLDSNGYAKVTNIDPGNCKVTFPDMDGRSWEKK